jgi:hypothetical protein
MPQPTSQIKSIIAEQAAQAAGVLQQQWAEGGPAPPGAAWATRRDAIIGLTYERRVKRVLPESQAWHPDRIVVGSEQWIG